MENCKLANVLSSDNIHSIYKDVCYVQVCTEIRVGGRGVTVSPADLLRRSLTCTGERWKLGAWGCSCPSSRFVYKEPYVYVGRVKVRGWGCV